MNDLPFLPLQALEALPSLLPARLALALTKSISFSYDRLAFGPCYPCKESSVFRIYNEPLLTPPTSLGLFLASAPAYGVLQLSVFTSYHVHSPYAFVSNCLLLPAMTISGKNSIVCTRWAAGEYRSMFTTSFSLAKMSCSRCT